MHDAIEIAGLRFRYGAVNVLDVPAWRLGARDRALVLGNSGSGKSTLLHVLAGLARPADGVVTVAGQSLYALSEAARDHFRGQHIGIVLQKLHLIDSLTVADNVRLAQYLAGLPANEARVTEVLDQLGMTEKVQAKPSELSGGQAQRVAIARAVVNKPQILLVDEPTASLDDDACTRVLELLDVAAAESALVIATHDVRVKARFPGAQHLNLRAGASA